MTLAERLARAGFVAAEEEAEELLAAAGSDAGLLEALVERRLTGEPLAWITGRAEFCGREVRVDPGRVHARAHRASSSPGGLSRACPRADRRSTSARAAGRSPRRSWPSARARTSWPPTSRRAVACARANGVEAYRGDLFEPLPAPCTADVVVGVVPYVPTPELPLLQRDPFAFESELSYDGGADGTAILRRVVQDAPRFLRAGGALLLELGAGQAAALALERHGYRDVAVLRDEEGDVRGVEATLASWITGPTG